MKQPHTRKIERDENVVGRGKLWPKNGQITRDFVYDVHKSVDVWRDLFSTLMNSFALIALNFRRVFRASRSSHLQ